MAELNINSSNFLNLSDDWGDKIFIIGGYETSIFCKNEWIYLFDSHSRDLKGMLDESKGNLVFFKKIRNSLIKLIQIDIRT